VFVLITNNGKFGRIPSGWGGNLGEGGPIAYKIKFIIKLVVAFKALYLFKLF